MGYYDDHYQTRQKVKRKSWFMPFVIGIVLGAFLFAVLLPAMVNNNWLPYQVILGDDTANSDQQIHQSDDQESETPSTLQNIQVDISTKVSEIVGDISPAVVGVVNIQTQSDFWEQEASGEQGTGSGVIYKIDGDKAYIVTNYHVVSGADQLEIVLSDEEETTVSATLVGSDLYTDLAVVEMDAANASKAIEFGNSDDVHVGEPAIAIGNPLGLHLSGSVTQGIISGKQRAIPQDFNSDGRADWQAEVIQTDAAINPGNSGGALINMDGKLIGINSMKIAQNEVEGIGFAIPVDDVVPIIEELEQNGEIKRPYLGIEAYSLNDIARVEWERSLNLPSEVEGGIYIRSVEPMSPADNGGLTEYDVITQLDGEPIEDIVDLRKHLYSVKSIGDSLTITYYREGEKQETTVELTSLSY
ncbi:trypsin-like peptidase domain-containing protein [Gracilibacillus caseinilyticus]|uniref:Trypsin-like peptidase domain-containing protein n=1 Tax=Gracilibacillus caseinilyticus TaxID=2932256 RepID=A0ABY4F134_9BACI|nr:trypsin-like peptidase domain-containing protein [Gracilibacillus caseinilyticus]UOQ49604.1 trypsin-like peptidase domain-containing protein [Gracilibacillus caseinilyticus]